MFVVLSSSTNGKTTRSRTKAYCMLKRRENTKTREITWFNHPYSPPPPLQYERFNQLWRDFFLLLNECFPKKNLKKNFHKVVDKNSIKLSYSCMKQKIDNHNRKSMSNGKNMKEFTRTCNCRDKTPCPLKGNYLQEGVVYKAIVIQTDLKKNRAHVIHRDYGRPL